MRRPWRVPEIRDVVRRLARNHIVEQSGSFGAAAAFILALNSVLCNWFFRVFLQEATERTEELGMILPKPQRKRRRQ